MRAILFTTAVFAVTLSACMAAPPERATGTSTAEATPPPPRGAAQGDEGGPRAGGGSIGQANAAGIVPLDKKKFGDAISESVTTPLPAIVKDPSQFTNRTVRTEGMVSAVCQSMGCWMQIRDESGKAHIKMAGHSFFVPKTSSGHRAIVQGKVTGTDQPNSCAAGDGCGNQEVTQIQIEATGVEFID